MNCLFSGYLVGVEEIPTKRKRQANDFAHYDVSPAKYIAAELSEMQIMEDSSFVVGDNQTYGSYYNPPLKEGKSYQLYTAVFSRINDTVRKYMVINKATTN